MFPSRMMGGDLVAKGLVQPYLDTLLTGKRTSLLALVPVATSLVSYPPPPPQQHAT